MISNNTISITTKPVMIKPGDVILTWCHVHGPNTRHLFTGNVSHNGAGLVCLECEPDEKKDKEKIK